MAISSTADQLWNSREYRCPCAACARSSCGAPRLASSQGIGRESPAALAHSGRREAWRSTASRGPTMPRRTAAPIWSRSSWWRKREAASSSPTPAARRQAPKSMQPCGAVPGVDKRRSMRRWPGPGEQPREQAQPAASGLQARLARAGRGLHGVVALRQLQESGFRGLRQPPGLPQEGEVAGARGAQRLADELVQTVPVGDQAELPGRFQARGKGVAPGRQGRVSELQQQQQGISAFRGARSCSGFCLDGRVPCHCHSLNFRLPLRRGCRAGRGAALPPARRSAPLRRRAPRRSPGRPRSPGRGR